MKYSWWFIQCIMILLSIFFTIFGIDLLIGAYSTDNPFIFIMIFFSSSLIILISLTIFIGIIIKIIRVHKSLKSTPEDQSNNTNQKESS